MTTRKRAVPHPFGQLVIRIRKEKNISAYRIAKITGKTTGQIRQIERGDNEPRIGTIIFMAEALEMDPTDLFRELVKALKEQENPENSDN